LNGVRKNVNKQETFSVVYLVSRIGFIRGVLVKNVTFMLIAAELTATVMLLVMTEMPF
jgi:hypothetical protein